MAARPRILVLQPFITEGAALDYRLLGLQFWLADRFTDIGLSRAGFTDRLEFGKTDRPREAQVLVALGTIVRRARGRQN